MNHKILNKLEQMIHVSPQLLRNANTMRQAIQATFNVTVEDVEYENIGQLVDRIDDKVLGNYFAISKIVA
jgi:ribosomal protein L23